MNRAAFLFATVAWLYTAARGKPPPHKPPPVVVPIPIPELVLLLGGVGTSIVGGAAIG